MSCSSLRKQKDRRDFPIFVTIFLVLSLSLVFFPALSHAKNSRLSVAYTFGVYQPSLKTLNRILGDPKQAILQDPNYLLPRNRLLPAEKRNISAPAISGRTSFGIDIQYEASKRFSLVATVSVWSGESRISDEIDLFLRQDLPPDTFPRSATYDLKVSQIWLGWKYNLFQDPDRGRFYLNFGLFGLSIADLTIDSVVKVNRPDIDLSFASVSSTEAQGTAFTSRFGVGGEYYVTESISFGIDVNYILATTSKIKVKRHFRSSFSTIPAPPGETTNLQNIPQIPEAGDELTTAVVSSQNITDLCEPGDDSGGCDRGAGAPLELELSGFMVTGVIRYYF